MEDILAVTRKEFREQLRRRSDLLRYVWFAVIFGGLFSLSNVGQGREGLSAGSLPWLAYAGLITASGATLGAFFSERQRGTLETLLASPLSDLAIFGGKVLFSLFVSVLSVAAAVAAELFIVNVALCLVPEPLPGFGAGFFSFPPLVYFALFVALPAVLLYTICVGSLISLRVQNIRTANLLNMLSVLPLGVPLGLLAVFVPPGLTWRFLLALTGLMLVVDAVALKVALALFGRETVVLNIPE